MALEQLVIAVPLLLAVVAQVSLRLARDLVGVELVVRIILARSFRARLPTREEEAAQVHGAALHTSSPPSLPRGARVLTSARAASLPAVDVEA